MKLTRLPYWCANPCEESLPNRISCTNNAMWVNNSANRCSRVLAESCGSCAPHRSTSSGPPGSCVSRPCSRPSSRTPERGVAPCGRSAALGGCLVFQQLFSQLGVGALLLVFLSRHTLGLCTLLVALVCSGVLPDHRLGRRRAPRRRRGGVSCGPQYRGV